VFVTKTAHDRDAAENVTEGATPRKRSNGKKDWRLIARPEPKRKLLEASAPKGKKAEEKNFASPREKSDSKEKTNSRGMKAKEKGAKKN